MEDKYIRRFVSRVKIGKPDDCWEWQWCTDRDGYGAIWINGKTYRANIVSYQLWKKSVPTGLCVLHTCDNPPCCNPNHLFLGTNVENIAERDSKGRCSKGSKHYSTKLVDEQILEIRRCAVNGVKQDVLAGLYGINQAAISKIINRKTWKHI